MATFTPRQGQFLAFIHLYRLLHKQGPAELDMVKFFRVTPPSVHGMVVKLEELGGKMTPAACDPSSFSPHPQPLRGC